MIIYQRNSFKTRDRELATVLISYDHPLETVECKLTRKPIFTFSKNFELKQLIFYFRNHVLLTDPHKIDDAHTQIDSCISVLSGVSQ